MKTLQQIKDKVARESYGCDHWDDFYAGNKEYPKELSEAFEEVADIYANEVLKEAADKIEAEGKKYEKISNDIYEIGLCNAFDTAEELVRSLIPK